MHVYQIEIVKGELVKLKSDLDEANIAHEGTLAALRQKHNNSMAELGRLTESTRTKPRARRTRLAWRETSRCVTRITPSAHFANFPDL